MTTATDDAPPVTGLVPEPLEEFDEDCVLAAVEAMDRLIITTLTERAVLVGEIQRSRMAAHRPVVRLAEDQQVINKYNSGLNARGAELALLVLEHCRTRD